MQSVKNGSESEWSETGEFALITFDDNADNSKLISTYAGKLAHVTLSGRTLYQDNTWNTIVLPFNLSAVEVEASPLAGADIRTLDSVSATDESVTLNFIEDAVSAYGQFYGGLPYIVKWASGSDIVNPEFANVTLTTSQYYAGGKSEEDENIAVYFEGTYAPIAFDAEDTSILFVGADNKLNYPLAGARIGAFRSYFSLDGISAGDASSVKILTNLDDEDATGIAGIENASEGRNWYDLSGRKLTSKPAQKGIYVTEGRKVSVK